MKALAKALLLLGAVLLMAALIAGWNSYSYKQARLRRQEERRQIGAVQHFNDLALNGRMHRMTICCKK